MHHTGEAEAYGGEVIGHSGCEDCGHRQAAALSGLKKLWQAAQAAAKKEEVGAGFEDALIDDRGATADGGVEGEAVVGAVADHEGLACGMLSNPVGFVFWRAGGAGLRIADSEFSCDALHPGPGIAAEDGGLQVLLAEVLDTGFGIVAHVLDEIEARDAEAILAEYGMRA